jgi:RNA polymerase sigma factor for flagellar operon FliA
MKIIKRSSEDRSKNGTNGTNGTRSNGSRANGNGVAGEDAVLLEKYRRNSSVKLRNQLVERYRRIVEQMARALRARLPRSVDVQDLTHAGVWGLIQAIENYRSELGPSFMPFMRIRVRGAMIDELRNMDYLPRLYRSRIRLRDEAMLRLSNLLDREPSDAELAEDLGVTESRLRLMFTMRAPHAFHRSPDAERDETQDTDLMGSLADQDQETPIEAIDRREMMEKIESSLQPIEWDVLRMHYLEGMSGKEVARKLHLSASRICQIHGRVLSRLKSRLNNQE